LFIRSHRLLTIAPTTTQHAQLRITNGYRCRVCRGVHALRKYQRLLRLPALKQLRAVLINQYCANSLAHEHSGQSCRSNAKRHVRTILSVCVPSSYISRLPTAISALNNRNSFWTVLQEHTCWKTTQVRKRGGPPQLQSASVPDLQPEIQSSPSSIQTYHAVNTHGVLLSTALIEIYHLGFKYSARALIDSGSEVTFISERLFTLIKLPYESIQAQVSWVIQTVAAQPRKCCKFHIGYPIKPQIQIEASAYVLPHLTKNLPSFTKDPKVPPSN